MWVIYLGWIQNIAYSILLEMPANIVATKQNIALLTLAEMRTSSSGLNLNILIIMLTEMLGMLAETHQNGADFTYKEMQDITKEQDQINQSLHFMEKFLGLENDQQTLTTELLYQKHMTFF